MANNLGSLVVSLGLDAAEFTKGLTKSQYQAEQFGRNVEKGIEFARNSFVAFAGAAVAAIAVVNRQAENVAAFQGLAEKIGDTAEAVASLKLASDISGVAMDSIAAASVKLTSALAKTDDEAKGVGAALGAIGLSVEQFKRLSPVDQIDKVAQAFSGYENNAQKTAVAVQLFGRSGAELIPLFNDLAGGAERQISLTQDQIDAADAYTKQTARLRSEVDSFVQSVAADAVPALSELINTMEEAAKYSKSAAEGFNIVGAAISGVGVVMDTVVVVGANVGFVLRTLAGDAMAYLKVSKSLLQFDLEGAKAIGEAYQKQAEQRRADLDAFEKRVLSPLKISFGADDQSAAEARRLGLNKPRASIDFNPGGPAKPKKENDSSSFLDYTQQISQRVGGLLESSDVTQAKIYADTLKQLDDLFFSGSLNADLYESALKKLTGSTSSAKDGASKFVEEQKRLADLLGATESAGIEKQRQDMELLTKALQDGIVSEQQYLEAVSARLNLVAQKTKEAKTFAEEFGLSFSSAFEDAVVSGGKFSDTLNSLADDITRIIVRTQVTEPLFNAIKGFDFGGFFGGLFGGTRANGGPVTGGTSYLVGERGPEIFTPSTTGRISPNGASGGNVTVNVISQGGGLEVTGQRRTNGPGGLTIDVIVQAVEAGMAGNVANRSGPLSRALESGYGIRPAMT
jgi:hypothetical protein